jgi:hypothetical protein
MQEGKRGEMIRVTVELLRNGDEKRKLHLANAYISNDLSGTAQIGNYDVILMCMLDQTSVIGSVKDFPRLKKDVWDLLYLALEDTVGDRNE